MRCRKPAEALARIYNFRGDEALAEEVRASFHSFARLATTVPLLLTPLAACPRDFNAGAAARAGAGAPTA
jgi:hypothetical protein